MQWIWLGSMLHGRVLRVTANRHARDSIIIIVFTGQTAGVALLVPPSHMRLESATHGPTARTRGPMLSESLACMLAHAFAPAHG